MRIIRQFLMVSLLALPMTGCMGSVGTGLDGRTITGHSGCFSYAGLTSNQQGATITLGGKTVRITLTQITWTGGALQLPATWSRLDLAESGNSIVVCVDGNKLANIRPTA